MAAKNKAREDKALRTMNRKEFQQFDNAMKTILRADPKAVKEALEREKRENAEGRKSKDDSRDKNNDSAK